LRHDSTASSFVGRVLPIVCAKPQLGQHFSLAGLIFTTHFFLKSTLIVTPAFDYTLKKHLADVHHPEQGQELKSCAQLMK
jgi:hypothetical protein